METKTKEMLEQELEQAQTQLKEVVAIANLYIKAHRDLLAQLRSAHDTAANYEVLLNEKLSK